MWSLAQIAAWFVTSKTGRAIAAGAGLVLAIGVAILKAFNDGARQERLRNAAQANRELNDALKEQMDLSDESRTKSGSDLDRDNAPWLRP